MIRSDKYIAKVLGISRSDAKRYISDGRVSIDGKVCCDAGIRFDENNHEVTFDGRILNFEEYVYYMFNKPAGVITATYDEMHRTVMDIFYANISERDVSRQLKKRKMFPVGRLDIDTEGLLLITDDGAMAHRLLSPVNHVDKTYIAYIDGILTGEDIRLLENGIDIGDKKPTLPAKIVSHEVVSDGTRVEIIIHEGRYHQIKRMFEAIKKPVLKLKRTGMGKLILDPDLGPGKSIRLSKSDIE